MVLDLSVGSQLLGGDGEGKDQLILSSRIFQHMQNSGVHVAVGRYNESRLLYAADQFEISTDEMTERRSIHLGVDLYLQSGTPVYAPLTGKVHSFRNTVTYKNLTAEILGFGIYLEFDDL